MIFTDNLFCTIIKGASGVVYGNFKEIGPLDSFLKPRNSTWLRKADLLFVVSTQMELLCYVQLFSQFYHHDLIQYRIIRLGLDSALWKTLSC